MLPIHARDLTRDELERLVRDLAARPDGWRHLVDHRADARTYAELHRDEHLAVWLICWMDDHDTGFHDHDLSAGAVAVHGGRRPRGAARDRRAAGRAHGHGRRRVHFGPSDIHRVSHAGAEPAITMHAYSPPLWRMGAYEVLDSGELHRWSMSYAEELRPISA